MSPGIKHRLTRMRAKGVLEKLYDLRQSTAVPLTVNEHADTVATICAIAEGEM